MLRFFLKNMATTHKSWRKVNKTQFNPLWWVFIGGFNRFKPGGLNWVGFNPSNPDYSPLKHFDVQFNNI